MINCTFSNPRTADGNVPTSFNQNFGFKDMNCELTATASAQLGEARENAMHTGFDIFIVFFVFMAIVLMWIGWNFGVYIYRK